MGKIKELNERLQKVMFHNRKDLGKLASQQIAIEALVKALSKWNLVESEMSNNTPCPDLALRASYRKEAIKLTEIALTLAKKEG